MRNPDPARLLASALVAVFLGACADPGPCDHVLARRYRSTTPGDSGLTVDGQVTFGPWSLEFSRRNNRDVWRWSFSDYGDSGALKCEGEELIFNDYEGSEKYRAHWDSAHDTLELEGMTYAFERTL